MVKSIVRNVDHFFYVFVVMLSTFKFIYLDYQYDTLVVSAVLVRHEQRVNVFFNVEENVKEIILIIYLSSLNH